MDTSLDLLGQLADLCTSLEDLDGRVWSKEQKRFLRKGEPGILKTIQIGTYDSVPSLWGALRKSGVQIGEYAGDILDKTTLSEFERYLDLVVVSVAELGLSDGAQYHDICKAAEGWGFELCPAEVGPQLRLQYLDQPKGECLFVAMVPIVDGLGNPNLFVVYCGHCDADVCQLNGDHDQTVISWLGVNRFVFVHGKKAF